VPFLPELKLQAPARLRRSATLPKYDIIIKPKATQQQGK